MCCYDKKTYTFVFEVLATDKKIILKNYRKKFKIIDSKKKWLRKTLSPLWK
jgi:uncharacterized protein YydD (DUF2326 family)